MAVVGQLDRFNSIKYDITAFEDEDISCSAEGNVFRVRSPMAEFVITNTNGVLDLECFKNEFFKYSACEDKKVLNRNLYHCLKLKYSFATPINRTRLTYFSLKVKCRVLEESILCRIDDGNISGNIVSKDSLKLIEHNKNIILRDGVLMQINDDEVKFMIQTSNAHKNYDNRFEEVLDSAIIDYYTKLKLADGNVEIFDEVYKPIILETDIIKVYKMGNNDNFKIDSNLFVNKNTVKLLCQTLNIHLKRSIVKFAIIDKMNYNKDFVKINSDYYLSDDDFDAAVDSVGVLVGSKKFDSLILTSARFSRTKSAKNC